MEEDRKMAIENWEEVLKDFLDKQGLWFDFSEYCEEQGYECPDWN